MNVLVTVLRLDPSGGMADCHAALWRLLDDKIRCSEIGAVSGKTTWAASSRHFVSDCWRFHRIVGRLVEGLQLRKAMGEYNRPNALEHFTASVVSAKLVNTYGQVGTSAEHG